MTAITRLGWMAELSVLLSCLAIGGMMMRKFAKCVLGSAVLAAAMAAGPAQAATWLITAQGTVLSGIDETGVFGFSNNTQLAGQAVAAEFLFDDATPNIMINGVPSRVSSRVVINGNSAAVGAENEFNEGSYRGTYSDGDLGIRDDFTDSAGTRDLFATYARSRVYRHNLFTRARVEFSFVGFNNQISGATLQDGLQVGLQANDIGDGGFDFVFYDAGQKLRAANGSVKWNSFSINLLGSGRARHFQTYIGGPNAFPLSPFGGVPEPTTWALLLFGFGFIGASLRASRRDRIRSVLN